MEIEKPQPAEKELIGNWIVVQGDVVGDHTCERIQFLTENYLEKLGVSAESGGWDTLFRDPEDGRFWECIYLKSEMHGGGPPSLLNLSKEEAKKKYSNLFID